MAKTSLFRDFFARRVVGSDAIHQVGHDGEIDEQRAEFQQRRMAMNLVNFEWDERTGDDDAEPLSPAFCHAQADAFRKEERSVKKAADAQIANLVGRQICRADQQLADVSTAGVEPQLRDNPQR